MQIWREVENAFIKRDNYRLIKELLKLKLFPIKDSYIAYLKRDSSAIDRTQELSIELWKNLRIRT
jgi:hypothetical protein